MKHRPDIDGLRALAVVPVILFHAGFETFSGGFVGVDIFFVISGYLISKIIFDELDGGGFSIIRFYERRIRRIIPALFVVIAACVPAAWLWMTPTQLKDFAQSVVAVTAFMSNVHFWIESGYFAATAETKPLLHTWSLSVEEQFYVVFPVLFIALHAFARKWMTPFIVLTMVASFALCLYMLAVEPTGNFFLMPTRAWEFLVGTLCVRIRPTLPAPLRNGLTALGLGLGLILLSVFAFDYSVPFPSAYALVPVLGTALILLFCDASLPVAAVLTNRACVGIGLISYSTYLWHQPLFAFARIRGVTPDQTGVFLGLGVVAMLLGLLSWKYVEQPFRTRSFRLSRGRPLFAVYAVASVALITAGAAGHVQDGFPSRMSDRQNALLA
jgi:peptidoglycan/LPS O-acetylase OafA/YrhL